MKKLKQNQKTMKKLREIIDAQKQKAQFEKEAELKSEFKVIERNGELWLTHCGVAFKKLYASATAKDIALMLESCREVAIEYARL